MNSRWHREDDLPTSSHPISSIPPEILSHILFHAIRLNPPFHEDPDLENQTHRPWCDAVLLSSVCKAWRTVVLHTPTFWTNVRSPCTAHIQDVLLRSGSLPVSLWIDDASCFADTVTPAASRVKDLTVVFGESIDMSLEDDQSLPVKLETLTTPVLESLTIAMAATWELSGSHLPFVLTRSLLQLPRPTLQHLCLIESALPEIPFPTFSQLRIFHLKTSLDSLPPLQLLLRALAAMPGLEQSSIHLADEMQTEADLTVGSMIPIVLSRLRSIDLCIISFDYSVALLRHLEAPSLSKRAYHIESGPEDRGDHLTTAREILTSLGFSANSESTRTYKFAHLEVEGGSISIRLDVSPTTDPACPTKVGIYNIFDYGVETAEVLLGDLSILGLENLVISCLENEDLVPALNGFLHRHTQIQHQEFVDTTYAELTELLGALRLADSNIDSPLYDSQDATCPLPKLERITFRSIEFEPSSELDDSEWLREVVSLVRWRESKGCPIHEITIEGCFSVPTEGLEYFRASVPSVKVNWTS